MWRGDQHPLEHFIFFALVSVAIFMALDLTPSLEKIRRAERKCGNVETILKEWIGAGVTGGIRTEVHGETAHVIARIETPLPDDIAWEVVEGVGHLRAALDKMLIAIVEANGRGVSGVGFPFGGISENGQVEPFPTARHTTLKKKLTPEQWALLMSQKPYPGGSDILWSVNEVANFDKHRKDLVRVKARPRIESMTVSNGVFIGGLAIGGDPNFICPDQERDSLVLSYAYGPGSIHPQIDPSLAVGVVFGPVRSVDGMDVLPTFQNQIRLAKDIVELFGHTFG